MIDLRLYRIALLPTLAGLVVLAFSLQPLPQPLEPEVTPTGVEGRRAAATAREIAELGGSGEPGSAGDDEVADLVAERFEQVPSGIVTEQRFDASVDGEGTELRNVLLTLPGESDRIIAVIAARDSTTGSGAASSAAATGGLLELAAVLANTNHESTIVLASTAAGSAGAAGARELADSHPQRHAIAAVIVLAQPAAENPRQPYLVTASTDASSTSIALRRTVAAAIAEQVGDGPTGPGGLGELARLALPSGLGEGSALIESGLDAVTITSAGEAPLEADEDELEDVSASSLERFTNAALRAVIALDEPAALEHGPESYIVIGDNLVPGWALAVLALALLLPATVVAVDGLARAGRRRAGVARALAWSASRPMPPLAALIVLYLLTLLGAIPGPPFPFDPNRFGIGFGEAVALLALAAVIGGGYALVGVRRAPSGLAGGTVAPALGLLSCASIGLVWLINPFLALLVVPAAHVWLLGARGRAPGLPLLSFAAAASLAPLLLAATHVGARLELGGAAPWHVILAISGGQVEPPLAVALCGLAGSLIGLFARPRPRGPKAPKQRALEPRERPGEAEAERHEPTAGAGPVGAGPQPQRGGARSRNGRKAHAGKSRASR